MEQNYTVKITEPAQQQLSDIFRYIAEELQEPVTANRLLDLLEREILSLAQFPGRIALTEEEPWHSAGIHKMPVKNYLVYFWIDEVRKYVQITAVIYARREQRQALAEMQS